MVGRRSDGDIAEVRVLTPRQRPGQALTFGIEEEFILLEPDTGGVQLVGPQLLWLLGEQPGLDQELMRFQFETATGICTTLAQGRAELIRLRHLVASAAESLGSRLVATGFPPYGTPGLQALTDKPRYHEMARRFTPLVAAGGTSGCHVHVGIPSRELGVQVLARLRPWLASLLAISANSPISDGRDTGWASRRYQKWSRWPTARPPEVWPDAAAYDAAVQRHIDRGAAMDEANVYFHARLSPRYPTVEVRIADVGLGVDDAVLVAGLVRAAVATALAEAQRDVPLRPAPAPYLDRALSAAALHGHGGMAVDPLTGEDISQHDLLHRFVEWVAPALDAAQDSAEVSRLLRLLEERGSGATRQRALWASSASPAAFTDALARATLEGVDPPTAGMGAVVDALAA